MLQICQDEDLQLEEVMGAGGLSSWHAPGIDWGMLHALCV